jgi:hypothetical protein
MLPGIERQPRKKLNRAQNGCLVCCIAGRMRRSGPAAHADCAGLRSRPRRLLAGALACGAWNRGSRDPCLECSRSRGSIAGGIVNLAARGMLVLSVARWLGSEGPLLAYCVARSNGAGLEKRRSGSARLTMPLTFIGTSPGSCRSRLRHASATAQRTERSDDQALGDQSFGASCDHCCNLAQLAAGLAGSLARGVAGSAVCGRSAR